MLCEVEEILDLFRTCRSVRGRAVLLVVGGFHGVLRRGVVQPRLRRRIVLRRLLRRAFMEFRFNGRADEIEGLVDLRVKLVWCQTIGKFDLD